MVTLGWVVCRVLWVGEWFTREVVWKSYAMPVFIVGCWFRIGFSFFWGVDRVRLLGALMINSVKLGSTPDGRVFPA